MILSTLGEGLFLTLPRADFVGPVALQIVGTVANPVRRRVLALLTDEEAAKREDLAEALARDDAVDADDAERIEVALHHLHLPKLEQEQFVDYDRRTGDVALWEDPTDVRSLLESE